MKDNYTLELSSPITEEQWDMISDVDFDRTEHITFYTKHGKEVEFYKNAIPISWLLNKMQQDYDKCELDTIAVVEIGRLIDEWRKENGNN